MENVQSFLLARLANIYIVELLLLIAHFILPVYKQCELNLALYVLC